MPPHLGTKDKLRVLKMSCCIAPCAYASAQAEREFSERFANDEDFVRSWLSQISGHVLGQVRAALARPPSGCEAPPGSR